MQNQSMVSLAFTMLGFSVKILKGQWHSTRTFSVSGSFLFYAVLQLYLLLINYTDTWINQVLR
jgi:hypothetical protein